MARNRNRNLRKRVTVPVFPGWMAVVLLSIGSMAFAYLWLNSRSEAIGRRIKELEQKKVAVQRRVAVEEAKWSNLTTAENMARLLRKHNLEMEWPKEPSIIRVRRPDAAIDLVSADTEGFARN